MLNEGECGRRGQPSDPGSGHQNIEFRSRFPMASGEMSSPQFTGFLTGSFAQISTRTIAGALIYVCMDWRRSRKRPVISRAVSRDQALARKAANTADFSALGEISQFGRVSGGPGRTRTCNQTVMSGLVGPEIPAEIGVFRRVRARLFAYVHGVSVVDLWSVPGRCKGTDLRIW